jgi:TolA-binding protein
MISSTSCASWRHKDAAEETAKPDVTQTDAAPAGTAQTPPQHLDPQQQKIETLTSSLSRAQARIEELDAKVSAMNDSLEGTRITVENLTGPQQNATPHTTPLGELADDVTSPAESAPQPKKKPAHRKAQVATAAVAVSAEDAEKNSDAIQHFTRGVNLMRKGSYADAVLIFTQFVERYPEHALASSAQFHAGECYFQMGEYKLAISEYEKMLRSYGNHPRVPSALVRLSQAYNAIGNTSEGSKYKDLAQANFAGNPSLDWPAPATRAAAPVAAKEQPVPQQKTATLETAPMEISAPHEEAH